MTKITDTEITTYSLLLCHSGSESVNAGRICAQHYSPSLSQPMGRLPPHAMPPDAAPHPVVLCSCLADDPTPPYAATCLMQPHPVPCNPTLPHAELTARNLTLSHLFMLKTRRPFQPMPPCASPCQPVPPHANEDSPQAVAAGRGPSCHVPSRSAAPPARSECGIYAEFE